MLLLVAVWPRLRTVVVNPPPPQPVPVAQALMPAANAAGGADPLVRAQRWNEKTGLLGRHAVSCQQGTRTPRKGVPRKETSL